MTKDIQNGIKEIGQIVHDKNRLVFEKFNLAEMESNIAKFDALLAENARLNETVACINRDNMELQKQYELMRGNEQSMRGRLEAAIDLLNAKTGVENEIRDLRIKYESVVAANREYTDTIKQIRMGGILPVEQIYKFKEDTIREQLQAHLGRTLLFSTDFENVILAQHPNFEKPGNVFDTFSGQILESLYYQDVYLGLFIQEGNNYSFQPATNGQN